MINELSFVAKKLQASAYGILKGHRFKQVQAEKVWEQLDKTFMKFRIRATRNQDENFNYFKDTFNKNI